ncbi:hypothetical protein [Streptomyces sp. NPDC059278]|uniref:hypothetical protein n=1 Tax=Streptomyces sp. NPDC059278 TaxID=3346801 RepID=UPI00369F5364
MSGAPEPVWPVAANVVLWRRYGDLGQELRPGTKAYRGGAKVYVVGTYPGTGHQQLTTVGHGRHTGHWITIDTGVRHLHTFRARSVSAGVPVPRVPARHSRVSRGFGASVRPVGGVRLPARYGSGQGAPGPS